MKNIFPLILMGTIMVLSIPTKDVQQFLQIEKSINWTMKTSLKG